MADGDRRPAGALGPFVSVFAAALLVTAVVMLSALVTYARARPAAEGAPAAGEG